MRHGLPCINDSMVQGWNNGNEVVEGRSSINNNRSIGRVECVSGKIQGSLCTPKRIRREDHSQWLINLETLVPHQSKYKLSPIKNGRCLRHLNIRDFLYQPGGR
eukprot:Protomagalhaensia_sp_Gyna_25__127@NODE_1061_length_2234_cov_8_901139_g845_i0_p4_GENE_NODE_1061_length_2234_cov_8_901139_g845_i0NODE_1061_length_2234_cov_8_901139_g845_i0_p4_ORF_typecomplete_len104_score0_43OxoGdeHyase_C/PF16870_5/0_17_NODE_1061_length_2234_cov_8_901139_g845_i0216527